MSEEQQKQMLELKYQMEKLQTDMNEVKQKEARTKKYERKASLKQKPNLDFMEEWLENSAILKEYYESEDQSNHWYKIRNIMKHKDVKDFIDRTNINLETTSMSKLVSNLEYTKIVDNIEKKMAEMKEFFHKEGIRCSNYAKHAKHAPSKQDPSHNIRGLYWDKISENQYPGPAQIKFVQSVFNMFKIQQEKIDKLEKEIEQLKTS